MRQNIEVVAASDKDGEKVQIVPSVHDSLSETGKVKTGCETSEPENREVSIEKPDAGDPTPRDTLLPTKNPKNNAVALERLAQREEQCARVLPQTGERGRLFLRVIAVKNLDPHILKSTSIPCLTFLPRC